jgi:hypothetical protein
MVIHGDGKGYMQDCSPRLVVSANVSPAKSRQGFVPSATFPVLNSSMDVNASSPE